MTTDAPYVFTRLLRMIPGCCCSHVFLSHDRVQRGSDYLEHRLLAAPASQLFHSSPQLLPAAQCGQWLVISCNQLLNDGSIWFIQCFINFLSDPSQSHLTWCHPPLPVPPRERIFGVRMRRSCLLHSCVAVVPSHGRSDGLFQAAGATKTAWMIWMMQHQTHRLMQQSKVVNAKLTTCISSDQYLLTIDFLLSDLHRSTALLCGEPLLAMQRASC